MAFTFGGTATHKPASPMRQGNSALSAPAPLATAQTYPIEFSGSGSEYFRIWIVNLLLILVTVGIYIPWAKVRKLKYFYGNTRIDGDAMDFHGQPSKMLRGTLIAAAFFGVYTLASQFSLWAGLAAALAFVIVWPVLYRASLKFRLSNTSWRGIRMHLKPSSLAEVYWAVMPPNLLLIVPLVLAGYKGSESPLKGTSQGLWGSVMGLGLILFILTLPYFLWRIKRFQVSHSAWGPLRMEFRSDFIDMYKVAFKTLFMALLIIAIFVAAVLMLIPGFFSRGWYGSGGAGVLSGILLLMAFLFIFFICMNILPRAYFSAHMQNLVWSRTGNSHVRFKSDLSAGSYMGLQLKNYGLILITAGLYWPFAVVATRRMQIEAVNLKTRIALDTLTDAARKNETDALGDMAADMFDFDMGM
jgi:uncharacterized membrane protein YjgN (DUF898 family)